VKTEMKRAVFDRLVESIKQAGKFHRGEMQPSRRFEVVPAKPRRDSRKSA